VYLLVSSNEATHAATRSPSRSPPAPAPARWGWRPTSRTGRWTSVSRWCGRPGRTRCPGCWCSTTARRSRCWRRGGRRAAAVGCWWPHDARTGRRPWASSRCPWTPGPRAWPGRSFRCRPARALMPAERALEVTLKTSASGLEPGAAPW